MWCDCMIIASFHGNCLHTEQRFSYPATQLASACPALTAPRPRYYFAHSDRHRHDFGKYTVTRSGRKCVGITQMAVLKLLWQRFMAFFQLAALAASVLSSPRVALFAISTAGAQLICQHVFAVDFSRTPLFCHVAVSRWVAHEIYSLHVGIFSSLSFWIFIACPFIQQRETLAWQLADLWLMNVVVMFRWCGSGNDDTAVRDGELRWYWRRPLQRPRPRDANLASSARSNRWRHDHWSWKASVGNPH